MSDTWRKKVEAEGRRRAHRSVILSSGSRALAPGDFLGHPNALRVLEQLDAAFRKAIAKHDADGPQTD